MLRTPKTLEGESPNVFQEILWLQYMETPGPGFRDKGIALSTRKVIPFYFYKKKSYKTSKSSFPLNLPTWKQKIRADELLSSNPFQRKHLDYCQVLT